MPKGILTMSTKEIDRGELIRRVRETRLTQAKAAALIGLSVRASWKCETIPPFSLDCSSAIQAGRRFKPASRSSR